MPRNSKAPADPDKAAQKALDIATIQALGAAQCPPGEVAAIMGRLPPQKLFKTKTEERAYHKGRAEGLKALRQAQLDMAAKSVPMATMLGRQYLGQTPQREQDDSAPIDYAGIAERVRDKIRHIVASGETEAD